MERGPFLVLCGGRRGASLPEASLTQRQQVRAHLAGGHLTDHPRVHGAVRGRGAHRGMVRGRCGLRGPWPFAVVGRPGVLRMRRGGEPSAVRGRRVRRGPVRFRDGGVRGRFRWPRCGHHLFVRGPFGRRPGRGAFGHGRCRAGPGRRRPGRRDGHAAGDRGQHRGRQDEERRGAHGPTVPAAPRPDKQHAGEPRARGSTGVSGRRAPRRGRGTARGDRGGAGRARRAAVSAVRGSPASTAGRPRAVRHRAPPRRR